MVKVACVSRRILTGILAIFLLLAAGQAAAEMPRTPLISADDLFDMMDADAPQVIDIRNRDAIFPLYSYNAGHVPGAVSVPLSKWREIWSDPLSVPSDRALTDLVRSAGLVKSRPVVVVHSSAAKGNFGSAAWVYWVLKSAGFTDLHILDGGVRSWTKAGYGLTKVGTAVVRSRERVTLDPTWLATHDDVDAIIAGDSDAQLLDARPIHQITKRASLAGSVWLDSAELMNGIDGEAGDQLRIFERLKFAGIDWGRDTVTYCNNGTLAAIDWFMASEIAGMPSVRLYGHSLRARDRARANQS